MTVLLGFVVSRSHPYVEQDAPGSTASPGNLAHPRPEIPLSGIIRYARRKVTFVINKNHGTDYENIRLDRSGQAEAFDVIGDRYDEAFPHKEGQVAAADWL